MEEHPKAPTYIENNRGNSQLIDHENHLYHKDSGDEKRQYWVCAKKKSNKCRAKATVFANSSNQEFVVFTEEHNHVANPLKVKAKIMDQKTINEAKANLVTAPSRILADSSNKYRDEDVTPAVLMSRRKTGNMIRSMNKVRAQAKGHSAAPLTMEEIACQPLSEQYTKTESGDSFLVIKDTVNETNAAKCFLIFMSSLGKELLRLAIAWMSDGTHGLCPKPFRISNKRKSKKESKLEKKKNGSGSSGQIYILFCETPAGLVLPCAFALLPDKESATYNRMWMVLHNELTNGGLIPVVPKSIGMDFEIAPANEFAKFWPDTKLVGCFFSLAPSHHQECWKEGLQVLVQPVHSFM